MSRPLFSPHQLGLAFAQAPATSLRTGAPQATLLRDAEWAALAPSEPANEATAPDDELEDGHWSAAVALDPRHRPQVWDEPSGTVRREWCRYPQEAHLLEVANRRYRRLTHDEFAIIQGFDPAWFHVPNVHPRNRARGAGDAVPPPLAHAVVGAIDSLWSWTQRTAIEVCAGSGGLASGAVGVAGMEHLLLLDHWMPACEILRHRKPWSADRVVCGRVDAFDFGAFRGRVGLLSGGPPCQPWSLGGYRLGVEDPRDLLARMHEVVAAIEPEVFVFENVPGLVVEQNRPYFVPILDRLRRPRSDGPCYGVMAGVLNAADYGVPQIRRRVFIIGLRGAPASRVYEVFNRIGARATHRDPTRPRAGRVRWRTLREALAGRADPGGWRRWVVA